MQGQQEQDDQHEDGRDDQLRTGARVLMVNVVSRRATRRTSALHYWASALRADQVFAAHRNPFRLARPGSCRDVRP
jgi:hypothetical protein